MPSSHDISKMHCQDFFEVYQDLLIEFPVEKMEDLGAWLGIYESFDEADRKWITCKSSPSIIKL